MITRVKICGIRSQKDLDYAASFGADAVGFIVGVTHMSEDALSIDAARRLAQATPPFINRVLVTHLTESAAIVDLAQQIAADTIQVHGLVDEETLRQVRNAWPGVIIRAVHVDGPESIELAQRAASWSDGILLDSRAADRLGGTGLVHDWAISAEIVRALGSTPCLLAGGLSSDNVKQAIELVKPFAVDLNSGVEDCAGDKDPLALLQFFEQVLAAR